MEASRFIIGFKEDINTKELFKSEDFEEILKRSDCKKCWDICDCQKDIHSGHDIHYDFPLPKSDNKYVFELSKSIGLEEFKSSFNYIQDSIDFIEEDILVNFSTAEASVNYSRSEKNSFELVNYNAESLSLNGEGVTVAIIDTGVDYNHPYLSNNFLDRNRQIDIGFNFSAINSTQFFDVMDDHGHGTNVAGIIISNPTEVNGELNGIAKKVKLLSFKINSRTSNQEIYISNVYTAIKLAHELGADVINNSWYIDEDKESETLNQLFEKLKESNCILVFGAGERGQNINRTYPQNTGSAIVVGGVDSNYKMSETSDWGEKVIVWAPSEDVLTTKKITGSPYQILMEKVSGTSIAAPFVTATIALLKQQNKSITFYEVIEKLQKGTKMILNEETGYQGYMLDIIKTIN